MEREEEREVIVQDVLVEAPQTGAGEGRGKRDRFLAISILIAAVVVGGSIVFSTVYRYGAAAPAGGAPSGAPGAAAPSPATIASIMSLGPRDTILGNANAPVTLVEYGDYQCPFCVRFFTQTEPQIMANYVNAGKVRMIFRNFAFLGQESVAAAAAAECANDQGKLWPYHDALYQAKANDEAKGGSEGDGFYARARFLALAQQVGLNIANFTSCIDSGKYATAVTAEQQTAAAAGINSTPTFYVNGTQTLGAQPYSSFQATIDAALAGH